MTGRQTILDLFSGKDIQTQPAFSGLIHITEEGLQNEGLNFHEVHTDARRMARAAASTFRLSGLPSAVVPLDMLVEAEALGAPVDFLRQQDLVFPQVVRPLFASTTSLGHTYFEDTDFRRRGRIPLVCEALQMLKEEIGGDAVIGAMVPGPYTLLLYLIEPASLFAEMKRDPASVLQALSELAAFLAEVCTAYRTAGADFITIHDMGASPGFIGPAKYEQFAFPAEKLLIEQIPKPRVLSVCGRTNRSMHRLAETGADAISVDQLNDLESSRAILTDTLLFGNVDPVAVLWQGDASVIRAAVQQAKEAGVDAVWPGCDLVPQTPMAGLRAFQGKA